MKGFQCLAMFSVGILLSSTICHRQFWPKEQIGQEHRVGAARRKGCSGQNLARLAMPADQMMLPATPGCLPSDPDQPGLSLCSYRGLHTRPSSSGKGHLMRWLGPCRGQQSREKARVCAVSRQEFPALRPPISSTSALCREK